MVRVFFKFELKMLEAQLSKGHCIRIDCFINVKINMEQFVL
jgi:hypothetical protein